MAASLLLPRRPIESRWSVSLWLAVALAKVRWDSAAGTYADPYIASGLLFNGCYPFFT